jgi:uncharacterized protein (TIGR00369 family)
MDEGRGRPEGSAGKGNPLERVRESFGKQGLMRLLGARVVEAGKGFCTIEVPFGEDVTQQERYFHGAVIGAVGDNAGGYAALTLAPPDREVLTVEYKVNFLAPARGERLVARGEVVTAGRRLFVCKAEVSAVNGDEEQVCAAVLQTVSLSPVDTANP